MHKHNKQALLINLAVTTVANEAKCFPTTHTTQPQKVNQVLHCRKS